MDKIIFTNLKLGIIIGTLPEERLDKQEVVINIELNCDMCKPCKSDDLEDAINYKGLETKIVNFATSSQFYLLEALADKIVDICLSYKTAKSCKVRIDKPKALEHCESIAIELNREKS